MSQFCQILEESDGLKSGIVYQVNQIFTKKNGHLYKGRRICELLHDEDSGKKMHSIKAKYGGVVAKLLIKPGDVVSVGQPLLEIEACAHPTTLGNICCDCGIILEDNYNECDANKTNGLVSMLHSIPDLKVSKEEAKKLGTEDINNLLENHKLVLLVDLDQTLIHTTNDNIPPKLKDVFHFQLAPNGPWYHTRLRPFAAKFLQSMSKYYELHICTFGVREYAHCIAHFLDKDHKLFGDRILSRNECLDPLSKKANLSSLFPCGDNLVCIIDDRSDVWNFAPNVVQVMPYHFFQHTGDINAPPGLQKIENDDDSKGYDFTKIGLDKDVTAEEHEEMEVTELKSKEKNYAAEEHSSDDSLELTKKRKSEEIVVSKNKRSKTNILDQESSEGSSSSNEEECTKSMPSNLSSEISDSVNITETGLAAQTSEDYQMHPLSNDMKSEESPMSLASTDNLVDMENITNLSQPDNVAEMNEDKKQLSSDISKFEETVMKTQTSNSPNFETSSKLVISCDDSQMQKSMHLPESADAPILESTADAPKFESTYDAPKLESTSDALKLESTADIPKLESTDDAPKLEVASEPNLGQESIKEGCSTLKTNDSNLNGNLLDIDLSLAKVEKSEKESGQKESDSDVIDVEDSDDYLLYLEDILINLHKTFYNIYNTDKEILPDLKQLVPETRKKVLRGTNIVFSGVIPRKTDLKDSKAFHIAISLGANVSENIIEKTNGNKNFTTHIIAANLHTEKVHIGKKFKHIKIVTPNWLWCCAERWEKVDERLFVLDKDSEKVVCRNPPMHCCVNLNRNEPKITLPMSSSAEPEPSTPTHWDSQKLIDSVNPLAYLSDDDAKSMEHEVDVELSDDDDNEVKEGANDASDTDSEESDNEESSKNNSEMDDCENDGLSKRRHSRVGVDDDEDDEVEEEEEEDELPSVRFRQGGTLSSEESDNEDDDDMNAYGDILAKELMD